MADTQETVDDIIAEARDKYTVHECNQCAWRKCCSKGFGSEECGKFRESIWLHLGIEDGYFTQLLDRLEAAHKREIDVLKQRCAELNAEVAAKDEVIKRLNDAISEEQRRKMATTENPSAVGNAAKLCKALKMVNGGEKHFVLRLDSDDPLEAARVAAAMRAYKREPRNCDIYLTEEAVDAATVTVRNCEACPRIDMEAPCVFCMVRWLLAPSEGR